MLYFLLSWRPDYLTTSRGFFLSMPVSRGSVHSVWLDHFMGAVHAESKRSYLPIRQHFSSCARIVNSDKFVISAACKSVINNRESESD